MPSPFPGIDPYIENPDIFPDFHYGMIAHLRDELNARLPEHYVAQADRHVRLHEPDADVRIALGRPDVEVVRRADAESRGGSATAFRPPYHAVLPAVPHKGNPFVKILDRRSRQVVTVLELLSPANKAPGRDRDAYLAKRDEYLASRVSMVELDLLRAGARLPMGEPAPPSADYYVLVWRGWEVPDVGIWPISVREPLPETPVPLSRNDGHTLLPLRLCVDRVYDGGRYAQELDYGRPPVPPLHGSDAEWAAQTVAAVVQGRNR